jgi:hypothetical protein
MNWQRNIYDYELDITPLPKLEVHPRGETARRARRAFLYGSIIFGVLGALTGAAWGQDTVQIGRTLYINGAAQQGTTVSISPSDQPGEWARVVMDNRHVNDGGDTGAYVLNFDGVPVGVSYEWDKNPVTGADAITVNPPAGITCLPADCRLTVMEGFEGEIILLDWVGS